MEPEEFLQNLEFLHEYYSLDCATENCYTCKHNISKKSSYYNDYCIYKFVARGWDFDAFVRTHKGEFSITIDEYKKAVKELSDNSNCGKHLAKSAICVRVV